MNWASDWFNKSDSYVDREQILMAGFFRLTARANPRPSSFNMADCVP